MSRADQNHTARPWLRHYPPGVPAEIEVRHPTMLALWHDAVDRRGESPCVYYFDAEFSYRRIDEDATALAVALTERGVGAGDRVGVLLQNDPQWLIALLATWKAGGVAVSLSPMLKARELAFQLRDSGAVALVGLRSLESVFVPAIEGSDVRVVISTEPGEWLAGGADRAVLPPPATGAPAAGAQTLRAVVDANAGRSVPEPAIGPDDVAVLTYTSGTTGPPKGAMITHRGLSHNSQVPAMWFALGPGEPVLGLAPLFHVTGLVLHMGVSWYAGSALVLTHRFDAGEVCAAVQRWRPAFTVAAITAYTALLNDERSATTDFSSLRVVASGGAPVTLGVVHRFRAATGLTISSVYGLTETSSPTHLTPPGATPPIDADSGALSVGVPIPGARVSVVDVATAEPVPVGSVGEIAVAGPMVVPGYWRRPEQSAESIPDGTLLTGDVGRMTEDGWFFVVDRKKDLIVASGYKVWPREVEEVLFEHPAVREAAVIGIPDEYRGESVAAWVVLEEGAALTADELIAFAREELAAYKYPRQITFVDAIPKNPAGKVLRRELRAGSG